ncbi:methyltransferase domain-containing protein [Tumidithrix helvetica]|uniref:methyltransferase domain-containing protein n=1 Tax=Tumidithrix helvetica TaxID=3457545 RepID=UPI003CC58594
MFDSVVSAWTLCSIAKVDRALSEIHCVFKPKGKFFFYLQGSGNENIAIDIQRSAFLEADKRRAIHELPCVCLNSLPKY